MKKKLLIYSDHWEKKSGYAREMRDLLPFFKKEFEVGYVSLGFNGYPLVEDKDIRVYPTDVGGTTEGKSGSYWAKEVLGYAIDDFNPDIVLTRQDYFALRTIAFELSKPKGFKWIHWGLCLTGDTKVLISDGTEKTIKEIVDNKLNVEVVSFDEKSKKFVNKKVVDWYKRDSSLSDWNRITCRNSTKVGSVTATKEHPFYTSEGWVSTEELKDSDKVYGIGKAITKEGKQALLGMYLGDGWSQNNGYSFYFSHSIKQEDYMLSICKALETNPSYRIAKNGFGKGLVNIRSGISLKRNNPELRKFLKNKKKVTREILEKLGDVGLAFWYMDDGSLAKDKRYPDYYKARLHTEGFSKKEIDVIVDFFNSINIKAIAYKNSYYENMDLGWTICIDRKDGDVFFKKIAPYIHKSMDYKLPDKYRSVNKKDWNFMEIKMIERDVEVRKLDSYTVSENNRKGILYKERYDIKVEDTHSFIANGFIVHNCDGEPLGDGLDTPLKFMHEHIFTTEFNKNVVQAEFNGIDGEVVNPPINPEIFATVHDKEKLRKEYGFNMGTKIILSVARNQVRKNLPKLIEGYRYVLDRYYKQFKDSVLILVAPKTVGNNGTEDGYDLEYFIRKNRLEERVLVLGQDKIIEDDELVKIYNLSDLFVLPTMGEGFGLIFGEATLAGLPILTTNYAAGKEFIENAGGYLINFVGKVYGYNGVAQAVVSSAAVGEEIRNAFYGYSYDSKKAIRYVNKLKPEYVAEKLIKIFNRVIDEDKKSLIEKG